MRPDSTHGGFMSVAARAPSSLKTGHPLTPRASLIYFWGVSLTWLLLLGWNLTKHADGLVSTAAALLPWVIALAIVNMLPVSTWPHANFTPDVPIFIAGAFFFLPLKSASRASSDASTRKSSKGRSESARRSLTGVKPVWRHISLPCWLIMLFICLVHRSTSCRSHFSCSHHPSW